MGRVTHTKTEVKTEPFNYRLQVKAIGQGLTDTFAALRLLAAADKIEKEEQLNLQRRS